MFSLELLALPLIAMAYQEARRRYALRVRAALDEGGVSQKRAALELGIDEGQLSRQLSLGILSGAAIDVLDPLTGGKLAAGLVEDLNVLTFRHWAAQQMRHWRAARPSQSAEQEVAS